MMEITNEKIYLELLNIKKLLQQSLDMQKEIETIEEEIKLFEGRQADEERRIADSVKKRKFVTVFDWKRAVWDHCEAKRDDVTDTSITFYCEILKAPCRFEMCPKNALE